MGPLWEHRMRSSEPLPVLNRLRLYADKIIISDVADRRGMAVKKMTPAELSYNFFLPDGNGSKFIDIAQVASAVNRRLYQQGRCYYVSRVSVQALRTPGASGAAVALYTIPDNWVTSNAYVKSKALWKSMQDRVLKDNPSVAGKWKDYKVYMDLAHQQGGFTASGPNENIWPVTFGGAEIGKGEWNMSTLVLPEHDVDPATGVVLAADEFEVHMMGADNGGPLPGNIASGGIIKMYQDTRARQQQEPLVPADMPLSWGTQLTDSGSQDPELAAIIDAENDLPPYDNDDYPGGDGNFSLGVMQSNMIVSSAILSDKDLGFKAPLGLINVRSNIDGDGTGIGFLLSVHLTPGHYKGLMTTEVKQ